MLRRLRPWLRSLWRCLHSTLNRVIIRLIYSYHSLLSRSKVSQALRIESARDLSPLYEAFSEEDDEHGDPVFLYSSFGFINAEYIAYFGKSQLRKYDLTSEEIRRCLELLPDDDVYPRAPRNITTSVVPLDGNVYIKRPKLHTAFIGTGLLPKLVLQEAETLELLLRRPHANIVRYYGCLIKRGRIVGFILDRYPMTLKQRLENGMRNFDVENCMSKLTSAVSHLHSLGLAHNDLTPMNILIDEHDTPIIIDFGSCQPFGCELITAGTPGWIDEEFTHSAQHHDEIALGKLQTWLETQK